MIRNNYLIPVMLMVCLSSVNSIGQTRIKNEIITELDSIYTQFESTVKAKNRDSHRELYLYDTAPVISIAYTPDGPRDYYSSHINRWSNYFSSLEAPYELKITDKEYFMPANGLALSVATFHGYESGELEGTGLDLFIYIKTSKGWKLAVLHNTVIIASDTTDYSKAPAVEGDLTTIPQKFSNALHNKDRYELAGLFHSYLSPYITYKDSMNMDFNYPRHSVGGFIDRITRIGGELRIDFRNIETEIYDNYIATINLDYTLKINEKTIGTGKHTWILYANADHGWKISTIFSSMN